MWPLGKQVKPSIVPLHSLSDDHRAVAQAVAMDTLKRLSDNHPLLWLATQVQNALWAMNIRLSKADCTTIILDIRSKH